MKFAFFGIVLFFFGCKIDQTATSQSIKSLEHHGALHVEDIKQAAHKNWLLKTVEKIEMLLGIREQPSPFCAAVLENSPTRDDYIRDWQPDGEIPYCPGSAQSLESCQKKHDDAFEAGLLCYQGHR